MTEVLLATAADPAYLPYLAAMTQTLAASRHPSTAVELTVTHQRVSVADRRRIESGAPGISFRWEEMTAGRYRSWGADPDPMLLSPHYFRCLLPQLYSPSTPRVLYLDADTLVLADLTPLWEWELAGNPVAAAGDLMSIVKDAISHWEDIGLDGDAPYFNSGVLVIDLALWRSAGIGDRVMRTCLADRHRLLIRGRWNQHDQYGFNVILQHSWTRLPPRWNHFAERVPDETAIVHFLGDTKPGADRTRPEFTRLFHQAIDATPWAGWRPSPPREKGAAQG
jgi:hypothetical protein